jgi:eukaryotic-like serine/threonine-protein kinase
MSELKNRDLVLTILTGDERGRIIVAGERAPLVVGRGEEADILLSAKDKYMGRKDISLERCPAGWQLVAIPPSTNAPRVNGAPVSRCVLTDGDIIQLGKTQIQVRLSVHTPRTWRCATPMCGADVSHAATSDGKALELADAVVYSCAAHVVKSDDLAGQSLGRYELCAFLGQGGEGVVYKVYDRSTARLLALKRLSNLSSVDLSRVERIRRFDRQILALQELRHTNIIRFVDCDADEDGLPYFVTEYAPNGSVADLASQWAYRLPPQLVIDISTAVLDGLQFLHARSEVHRDIKPQNILLRGADDSPDPQKYIPKIADFGLVKRLHGIRITRPHIAPGTRHFMPPEQFVNFHELDGRADLYALGATLYFVLTGNVPVNLPDNADEAEQFRRLVHGERVPVRDRVPTIPPRLAAVVDRACCRDVEHRFQTAEEFQQALGEAL